MTMRFDQRAERLQQSVAQAPFHTWRFADGTLWMLFFRSGGDYFLRFPGLADFEVSATGLDVQGWPAPGVDTATVRHLYLNQVRPLALSRQGKLVLHASAVAFGSGCAAFIGESGRGKSTLAASFAINGNGFLTDDGLPLAWQGDQLTATPSHPSVRLWADSEAALLGGSQEAAPPVQYTQKSRFLAGDTLSFCAEQRPLRAVYFLGTGEAESISIERMKPPVALLELVRHSFLLDVDEQQMLASHFDEISRIANLPIHYHLDYPRRFEALPLLRDAIARSVAQTET